MLASDAVSSFSRSPGSKRGAAAATPREPLVREAFSFPEERSTMEHEDTERYEPEAVEAKWQRVWADERAFEVSERAGAAPKSVRPRDAAVPLGRAPHGARLQLHARRRLHARPAAAGPHVLRPHGLRRVRPARRERRDQGGRPPARDHRAEHRAHPPPDEADGLGDRLVARGLDRRPGYYRWTQWLFLRFLERGLAYRKGAPGQVVPEGPDRARERAGDRRPLRALRHRGRVAAA